MNLLTLLSEVVAHFMEPITKKSGYCKSLNTFLANSRVVKLPWLQSTIANAITTITIAHCQCIFKKTFRQSIIMVVDIDNLLLSIHYLGSFYVSESCVNFWESSSALLIAPRPFSSLLRENRKVDQTLKLFFLGAR